MIQTVQALLFWKILIIKGFNVNKNVASEVYVSFAEK